MSNINYKALFFELKRSLEETLKYSEEKRKEFEETAGPDCHKYAIFGGIILQCSDTLKQVNEMILAIETVEAERPI